MLRRFRGFCFPHCGYFKFFLQENFFEISIMNLLLFVDFDKYNRPYVEYGEDLKRYYLHLFIEGDNFFYFCPELKFKCPLAFNYSLQSPIHVAHELFRVHQLRQHYLDYPYDWQKKYSYLLDYTSSYEAYLNNILQACTVIL